METKPYVELLKPCKKASCNMFVLWERSFNPVSNLRTIKAPTTILEKGFFSSVVRDPNHWCSTCCFFQGFNQYRKKGEK